MLLPLCTRYEYFIPGIKPWKSEKISTLDVRIYHDQHINSTQQFQYNIQQTCEENWQNINLGSSKISSIIVIYWNKKYLLNYNIGLTWEDFSTLLSKMPKLLVNQVGLR